MIHVTEYKIIEGNKESFEKKINEISKDGFMWCGNMNTMPTRDGMHYSQLVSKTTSHTE